MPNPANNKKLKALASWCGVFTDPTRIMILMCLSEEKQNVTQIAKACDTEIVNISHHLGVMKQAGIVDSEKDGRFMLYSLVGCDRSKNLLTLTHEETGVKMTIPLAE